MQINCSAWCPLSPSRKTSRIDLDVVEPHPVAAVSGTFCLLEPHLEAVDLPVRKRLEERNKRVENVYFPESGFASVVAVGECPMEVGMIGREGMTGLSVVTGIDDRAQYETYMQMAGNGFQMKADDLRKAIDASVPLHRTLLHFVHAFMMQTMETAVANGAARSRCD